MTVQQNRKFLGVHFHCCSVYTRVYINRDQTAYEGACPKCGRRVKIPIDPRKGTSTRFFDAY
jgi:PHP family Zn ribbon phosphoesterase